jgi:hypothetical protein
MSCARRRRRREILAATARAASDGYDARTLRSLENLVEDKSGVIQKV